LCVGGELSRENSQNRERRGNVTGDLSGQDRTKGVLGFVAHITTSSAPPAPPQIVAGRRRSNGKPPGGSERFWR
jgi:hypothetical protein